MNKETLEAAVPQPIVIMDEMEKKLDSILNATSLILDNQATFNNRMLGVAPEAGINPPLDMPEGSINKASYVLDIVGERLSEILGEQSRLRNIVEF